MKPTPALHHGKEVVILHISDHGIATFAQSDGSFEREQVELLRWRKVNIEFPWPESWPQEGPAA